MKATPPRAILRFGIARDHGGQEDRVTNLGSPLAFDEFRRLIATELQLDEAQVQPRSCFVEELGVDSVRMVELMLRLEELGIRIPPEAAWEIQTVEDAYRCYLEWAETVQKDLTADAKPQEAGG